ncbi:MAG: dTMP kinase [Isosphaeraceae bacterium]|nr:dTMP kinase [Isosphaeraceae bacterium]
MPSESRPFAEPRGRFVVLDGPDGGGKTTQVARLVEWLRSRGLEVVACRDPGGTAIGEKLRAILLDRGDSPPAMRTEMLLFMAARAQLVSEVIEPALERGAIVVSDRFLLANIVYQGHAGGLSVEELRTVGRIAVNGLAPDLTMILDLPVELGRARVGSARDRLEDRSDDYHRAVRNGFLEELETLQGASMVIDASCDPETVTTRIRAEVSRVLAID